MFIVSTGVKVPWYYVKEKRVTKFFNILSLKYHRLSDIINATARRGSTETCRNRTLVS